MSTDSAQVAGLKDLGDPQRLIEEGKFFKLYDSSLVTVILTIRSKAPRVAEAQYS